MIASELEVIGHVLQLSEILWTKRHAKVFCINCGRLWWGFLVGCQVDVSGQTLPSAYYLQDDIQYFPAGPEFKLSKEAAALKAYKDQNGGDAPTNCDTCR